MTNPHTGLADELERLAALHKAGVLTDDEFKAQKARLLNPTPVAAPPVQKSRSVLGRVVKWTGIAALAFVVFPFFNAEYPELFLPGLPTCDASAARTMIENTVEENSVGLAQGRRIIRWVVSPTTVSSTVNAVRCHARVALSAGGERDMAYAFEKKDNGIMINVEFDGF